jgi:hypothetical protein
MSIGAVMAATWAVLGIFVLALVAACFALRESKRRRVAEARPDWSAVSGTASGSAKGWLRIIEGLRARVEAARPPRDIEYNWRLKRWGAYAAMFSDDVQHAKDLCPKLDGTELPIRIAMALHHVNQMFLAAASGDGDGYSTFRKSLDEELLALRGLAANSKR